MLSEPREASGLTTRLVLTFVEREGGRAAVDEVLSRCGLSDREDELRDENAWFPDHTRTDLFEAAAATLGDPDVARRIGSAAIGLNVGQALKLSLRALGSPKLIYSNIGRASGKFNRVHRMDVLHCGSTSARIRNVPIGDAAHHPTDCGYNMGLLSCVPLVFGEPKARVRHPRCIGNGDPECIYEVEWSALDRSAVMAAIVAAALVTLTVVAIALPELLPVATAIAGAIAVFAAVRVIADRRRRWRLLQNQLSGQAEATDLMAKSMQDLVSALQLDEVLSKVTANAQSAVGGAEFALLVAEPGGLRARSSSDLPPPTVAMLEAWGSANATLLRDPVMIDDLATVPELAGLPLDHTVPLGSLCASPLVYRGSSLGVLIALSTADSPFFPRDIDLLSSYAAQAAIALTNARLFEAQQELAIQDPLTGLFNHRHFHETLGRELDRCRRHGGELGLVMFDLDGFKGVNDTGGHAEGDEVLRRVADALGSTCRSSDLPFRVGGDEFALVLPSAGPAAARAAAERACAVIDRIDERTTISFGVASWPDAGPTKDALLDRADRSLYRMKRATEDEDEVKPMDEQDGRQLSKHERLACASRIAVKLAPLLDEAAISRTAVAELQETFGYHRVAVHRTSALGLVPVASAGLGGLPDQTATEAGSAGRAARSGEAVLVADTTGSEAGSELAMPIRVDGDPWGVLELAHHEPGGFDFDDLLFADTIGAAIGAALHRCQLYAELEGTFMRTLAVLSDALEAKDSYTAAHAREVADLTVRTAGALGMEADDLRTLRYGALLHDIGKISIRSEILHKPGPLTDAEYEEIKEHTVVGAKMLERIPYFADVHPLVRSSHERWDGRGYPDELAFEAIPLGARVIAACDAFHAMTSDRPYRAAMERSDAIEELRRCSGTQFDPSVIDALVGLLDARPAGDRETAAAR
ncbi:MAG: diguanylate cyclase [Solirubrobacterales bacterium]|nr:diguanylate cyclase [Solirubrobacterales bacterium]MCB8971401.1 diguanylate cyclase [Thermoleophilales bacterium]MCO5327542.1 diguanylate cyclase [Solirubrobacterales bacterium]